MSRHAAVGVIATFAVGQLLAAESATQPGAETGASRLSHTPVAHSSTLLPAWVPEWITNPPFGITWVSFFGGVGAISWKLYEHIEKRRDRSRDLQLETDAFWYQAIVIEQILNPLLDFVHTQSADFAALAVKPVSTTGKDPFLTFSNEYQRGYSALGVRMRLLQIVSQPTLDAVMSALDDLEDAVSLTCHESSVARKGTPPAGKWTASKLADAFAVAQIECVAQLKRLHESLRTRH